MHISTCLLVEFHKFLEGLGLAFLRRKNGSFNLGKNYFLCIFIHLLFSLEKLHQQRSWTFSLHLFNLMLLARDKQCYSVTFRDPCMPTVEQCLFRMSLCMHLAPFPFWDLKALFRGVKYFYPVCKWAINREVKQFACVHVARLWYAWKITGPLLEKSFLDILILLNISRTFSYTVGA